MRKPKRGVTDAQFKNQVIFTIKGMQANLAKIHKMFPEAGLGMLGTIGYLEHTISCIRSYEGSIVRKPK